MIETGKPLPAFSLLDDQGNQVPPATFAGSWTILYVYPKDATPGCTTEACDFRDNWARVQAAGAKVFGLSRDTVASHRKFADKQELPFPLLSDPDKTLLGPLGAFGRKVMYGKETEGIIRSTFLVDPQGVIRWVWPKVSVKGHVEAVLATLSLAISAGATHRAAMELAERDTLLAFQRHRIGVFQHARHVLGRHILAEHGLDLALLRVGTQETKDDVEEGDDQCWQQQDRKTDTSAAPTGPLSTINLHFHPLQVAALFSAMEQQLRRIILTSFGIIPIISWVLAPIRQLFQLIFITTIMFRMQG